MVARGAPYLMTRKCRGRCRRILMLSEYHIDNEASDGRQAYCPQCKADSSREARWFRYYGLRPGRAQRCLELQGDVCPLCGLSLGFKIVSGTSRADELVVDHDHNTGEVRGLIHRHCNTRPPADGDASLRWHRYASNPPMRAAHDGIPLIAPSSGAGDAQLPLLEYEPPVPDLNPPRRGPHPRGKKVGNG